MSASLGAGGRIGVDLGGTKIAGTLLLAGGQEADRLTIPAPRDDYRATLDAIAGLVRRLEAAAGAPCPVGIGMPGSLAPSTGLVQGANSTWLNGRPLKADLEVLLSRVIRLANDANCFALSEAADGAAAGARIVFGVILGTGCGGGIVIDGRIVDGPRGIGGEWGHNPLPWPDARELQIPPCWCGRTGCMETWVAGPALAADHARTTGDNVSAEAIAVAASSGDAEARATLTRHAGRLARGLATIVNLIDPDVIVLGGGLSSLAHLYAELPDLMAPYIFAADASVRVVPPRWGAASGVRGAARLWPAPSER